MILDDIFGSKGKVALFTALFDGRRRRFHIRELARKVGLTAPSLMREAKSLVAIGLLCEEKDGNRVDYWANTQSPIYQPLETLVEKTVGPQASLAEAFADSPCPIVFIYGSRARGTERADSDFDVFVIGDEGLRSISARVGKVAEASGVEVNPYVVTAQEFKKRLAKGDHFLTEVMAAPKIFLKGGENELAGMA